jgi:hypothetical protein
MTLVLALGVDRHDVRVFQPSDGVRFFPEAADRRFSATEHRRQDLEGNIAVQRSLSGPINDTHATPAYFTQDFEIVEAAARLQSRN